ncbi:MAG: ATP-binding protein [Clostridia bacterium]|nr:ATP-binding protein [Clostridia bacterium]
MRKQLQPIYLQLCSVAVFRKVTELPLFRCFERYCSAQTEAEKRKAYAAFAAEIYAFGGNLTELVETSVFMDENVYVKAKARGQAVNENIQASVEKELKTFSTFASLTPADFAEDLGVNAYLLPSFDSEESDLNEKYALRLKDIDRYGYGIFAAYGMFRVSDDKKIEPIVSADKIGVDSFVGYEEERAKVVENTLAFIEGRPAANTLLCGDAGTGKSSTVKALANEYFDRGLRLIELRKDQLSLLPYVMGEISENPLKFIIFIDDLAFSKSDDNFSMLKAALEGSASAQAENAVIYATSNRRHIIKEAFSDREGDDVHRNDTLQETLSLSERFGLTVYFQKPNKALYQTIVKTLALRKGIDKPDEELFVEAEAFALKKGNRSPRCAEQFIDSLLRAIH